MDGFSKWYDNLPDDEAERLRTLSLEYASAIVNSMPKDHDRNTVMTLGGILLSFYSEAAGQADGLPMVVRRDTPWAV